MPQSRLYNTTTLAASRSASKMLEDWNEATQEARRAFLAGNEQEMQKAKEVVEHEAKELNSLLDSVQSQLKGKAGSSMDAADALKIVEKQQEVINSKRVHGLGQANQNFETVKALLHAQAKAPTAISWKEVDQKLASVLEELKTVNILK